MKIIFVFIFLSILLITDGRILRRKIKPRLQKLIGSNDFDLLIFTQHWPETVCYTWKENSMNHTCNLPRDEEWTIHGIWPTQFHKEGPAYCNPSMHFDFQQLAPIQKDLETKWIDVENGTQPYSFWRHEWEKHGTCAVVIPEINNEIKYFKKGLELLDQYDMKHVLAKANIFPGQEYLVKDILNGVAKVLGKHCQVECVTNSKTKESYLFEIRICMDKQFNLVDCDNIAHYPTNCARKKKVIYPGAVPTLYSAIMV
ncbi:ribonuclease Oy [Microplitis demolitor]|uniref:ribonuclease Oy n=1 Tax=Microplitis demolitor TaxID=69319 RepID=UPI0004CCCD63|nr:ribonuclease Oy [Microplitis demolitor]